MSKNNSVIAYDANGKKAFEFESVAAACKALGTYSSSINRALKAHCRAAGYYWRRASLTIVKHNTEPVGVWQWTQEGELLAKYSSCKEAARLTGAHANAIGQCLANKAFSAGGYRWTREGVKLVVEPHPLTLSRPRNEANARPIIVVPADTPAALAEELAERFPSITDAVRALNIPEHQRTQITKVLEGERISCHGFYFFDEDCADLAAAVENCGRRYIRAIAGRRTGFGMNAKRDC